MLATKQETKVYKKFPIMSTTVKKPTKHFKYFTQLISFLSKVH